MRRILLTKNFLLILFICEFASFDTYGSIKNRLDAQSEMEIRDLLSQTRHRGILPYTADDVRSIAQGARDLPTAIQSVRNVLGGNPGESLFEVSEKIADKICPGKSAMEGIDENIDTLRLLAVRNLFTINDLMSALVQDLDVLDAAMVDGFAHGPTQFPVNGISGTGRITPNLHQTTTQYLEELLLQARRRPHHDSIWINPYISTGCQYLYGLFCRQESFENTNTHGRIEPIKARGGRDAEYINRVERIFHPQASLLTCIELMYGRI